MRCHRCGFVEEAAFVCKRCGARPPASQLARKRMVVRIIGYVVFGGLLITIYFQFVRPNIVW